MKHIAKITGRAGTHLRDRIRAVGMHSHNLGGHVVKLSRIALSIFWLAAISLPTMTSGFAASLEKLHATRNVDELQRRHGPTSSGLNAQERARRYAEVLSIDSDSTLTLVNSSELETGNHYRYQQLFRGVPVYGAVVVVSENLDGSLRDLGGELARGIENDLMSVEATISPQQALAIAKREALSNRPASASVENEKAEKTIYIDSKGVAHLTYKTSFYSVLPDGRDSIAPTFIIEANTGEILHRWNDLKQADATGPMVLSCTTCLLPMPVSLRGLQRSFSGHTLV